MPRVSKAMAKEGYSVSVQVPSMEPEEALERTTQRIMLKYRAGDNTIGIIEITSYLVMDNAKVVKEAREITRKSIAPVEGEMAQIMALAFLGRDLL